MTNGSFDPFDPSLRILLVPAMMTWKVMNTMPEAGGCMVEEIRQMRAQKEP